jgi:hypothetical protein
MATATFTIRPGCRIVHGSYTGDTAVITLNLGAQPIYGRVWNYTDGDTIWEYHSGMAAGYALKHTVTATAEHAVLAANGFTALAGTYSTSAGITLGTDMSENAKVFHFMFILP